MLSVLQTTFVAPLDITSALAHIVSRPILSAMEATTVHTARRNLAVVRMNHGQNITKTSIKVTVAIFKLI